MLMRKSNFYSKKLTINYYNIYRGLNYAVARSKQSGKYDGKKVN